MVTLVSYILSLMKVGTFKTNRSLNIYNTTTIRTRGWPLGFPHRMYTTRVISFRLRANRNARNETHPRTMLLLRVTEAAAQIATPAQHPLSRTIFFKIQRVR